MTSHPLLQSQLGTLTILLTLLLSASIVNAQTHDHDAHQHGEAAETVEAPKVFLDKSPKIVEYQLKRLDNQRLLLVERKTDDPKYAPVYAAILTRGGISQQYRDEALAALVVIRKSNAAAELLAALQLLDPQDRQQQQIARQLAKMLLTQPVAVLQSQSDALIAALTSQNSLLRSVGHAALIVAGLGDDAWSLASKNESATLDWLDAVPLVPNAKLRSELRDAVVLLVSKEHSNKVRVAAINALRSIPSEQDKTFELIARLMTEDELRDAAVRTLLKIPADQRSQETGQKLVDLLVKHAEQTPAADRTKDAFIDAMQLVDQLLAQLPVEAARSYRDRLREITVRVVRIHTVEEEMRYDTAYFAVEAGRSVQIILKNEDLMPHNLVITQPDALQEVAELGLAAGPNHGVDGKQYVPDSDKVLYATHMVQARQQESLTFTAPSEPGEYPYVCTFPQHWMRMYGVMVVVKDLDQWLKNPVEPKDPVGSNRPFVQSWTLDDLVGDLESGLRGRSAEIGQRIFKEASCAQCHKIANEGGDVGPALDEVFGRWKGDRSAVLREILDPSHHIDDKYAVQLVETVDGLTITGIIKSETKDQIEMLDNPNSKETQIVPRDDIVEMIKTGTSLMPKALLDRFTKDEIFELFAYIESNQKAPEGK
jgi:putative heme-binding domain-containing protein